jgi:hypothetical protein
MGMGNFKEDIQKSAKPFMNELRRLVKIHELTSAELKIFVSGSNSEIHINAQWDGKISVEDPIVQCLTEPDDKR